MALIACPECSKEVSSAASACPSCAYPITPQAPAGGASAPVAKKKGMGIVAKILLGCVGLFAIFILYGMSIPENEARAREAFRVCRDMFAKGQVATMYECQQLEARIKNGATK